MTIKVGINGFGRIGRLVLRAVHHWGIDSGFVFTQVNDPAGDADCLAHLLNFDSVHGRFSEQADASGKHLNYGNHTIKVSHNSAISDTDWSDCDIVLDASGKFKTEAALSEYFKQGVKRVLISAPVKSSGALNVVMGVNDGLYDKSHHKIVTASSCTTNCLAPAVKVIQEHLGIKHGSFTTIHDITNTQTIIDAPHKDLRRARACGSSLIPTTTGSATAIGDIFPNLKGKLNGHAVRVPLCNASLTDCVFELETATTASTVNTLLKEAANGELSGILGFETRPLVSVDFRTDPRSCIVDAMSTMVTKDTQLKLFLWYDNEWGYANRTAELIKLIVSKGV